MWISVDNEPSLALAVAGSRDENVPCLASLSAARSHLQWGRRGKNENISSAALSAHLSERGYTTGTGVKTQQHAWMHMCARPCVVFRFLHRVSPTLGAYQNLLQPTVKGLAVDSSLNRFKQPDLRSNITEGSHVLGARVVRQSVGLHLVLRACSAW